MEPDKWKEPGWKIEQNYSSKVLVGNWAEERLQFTRECKTATSTHRHDYHPQRDHQPDVFVRREALRKAEGLPTRLLLDHHGTPRSHYLVSLYDETFSRKSSSAPPTLRCWNSDKLAWVPERSDHPAAAPPTNFGLAESRLVRLMLPGSAVGAVSVYRSAFPWHPAAALRQPRCASVPRALSSHLHPANSTNKDLRLKDRPYLQVPDHPARLLPPLSVGWTPRATARTPPGPPGSSEATAGITPA
ncbi:uncharacterized protein C1orf158 homolog [Megalops cyprinoides]|uniref:uncharacterized protein C1orf158 homolog n=1 Tax=Megalops cyprinoides TaxID=118141 RepID=UPI0018641BB4|nr:uncharacterized protein C1orf158 homolog [Megalops cyprinoides]